MADRRVLRGERNAEAIAGAAIALIEEKATWPTAHQVADRAGVAPSSVYHHFADMESLMATAAQIQQQRHWNRLQRIDPDVPVRSKIEALVEQRCSVYEEISVVRRAATLREAESPVIAGMMAESRRALRRQISHAFPELSEIRLDAFDAAASFETWDHFRRHLGRSQARAKRAFAWLIASVVEEEQ